MKVAIMQPYFLPYIGYFQLIRAADVFVVYDNIKFTKRGWINRNRYLLNGRDELFSLPLEKASDALDVRDRCLAPVFDRIKFLNRFSEAYRAAPYFNDVMPLLRRIVGFGDFNLFNFIHASLREICGHLSIGTPLIVSSALDVNHDLKGQDRVLAICRHLGADTYINASGGRDLYSKEIFNAEGMELKFLRSHPCEYPQFHLPFVPSLSILDVMMFNSLTSISDDFLFRCELV
ncbi:WbqC family protein [Simplicispira lacusdiani]|uniref:WbqC family protein n=1 Tax=Simplicispira lacusdiani TaxID=2213010 RepID=UPI000E7184B9|nr:WbqC family protein [Simplicispira lacusdiani]